MKTPPLVDAHGRTINYLRLSVTDRCNLRCRYCMPAEGIAKRDHHEILTFEDLYEIAECATSLGVRKIRVTGGEPLVRKGILAFLQRLSNLPGLDELVLTTNGTLLPGMAEDLRAVGVRRLNISLDSLRPETFSSITRKDNLEDVLSGIEAARRCDLPVKVNTVVMGGVNDDEILDFVRLTLDQQISVRFIEYMPVMKTPGWQDLLIPG
ncbi:MAG: radical SAM protein, partial [Desulfuromonadales bacterium]|nr:radical SAM protein [Desulfuromonadales bacterium]NIS40110.1 radical SAM protein [Desulfuromonadales bacterium]